MANLWQIIPAMKITRISITLDKRYKNRSHEYPVKVLVNFWIATNKQEVLRLPTGIFLTEKDYKRILKQSTDEDRARFEQINLFKRKAESLAKIPNISPNVFKDKFDGAQVGVTFRDHFEELIRRKKAAGGFGQIQSNAFKSFLDYDPSVRYLSEISVDWLQGYQKSMLDKGRSKTTIAMYLTELKTLLNQAVKNKTIEYTPFEDFKIQREVKYKIPLNIKELRKVIKFKTTNEHHQMAVDFWLICFNCYGANIGDIISFKFEDIQNGFLIYDRKKTRNRKTTSKPIYIPITEQLQELINKYKRKSLNPKDYIFTILDRGITDEEFHKRKHAFLFSLNQSLRKVAKKLGIAKLNTNLAKHTANNILLNKNVPLSVLQYINGHTDPKTTLIYTGSIHTDKMKEISKHLKIG